MPLLEQLQTDVGPTVSRLAEGRLGVNGSPQSVRQQAKRMGVTRARVYQLLEDCANVMRVRWPEGRCLLEFLHRKLEANAGPGDDLQLLKATFDLFYGEKHELADGQAES